MGSNVFTWFLRRNLFLPRYFTLLQHQQPLRLQNLVHCCPSVTQHRVSDLQPIIPTYGVSPSPRAPGKLHPCGHHLFILLMCGPWLSPSRSRCGSEREVAGVPREEPLKVRWDAAECWWHVWLTRLVSAEPHAKNASKVKGIKWLFLIFTLSFKRSYRFLRLAGFTVVPLTMQEGQATTALHAEGRIWMPHCRKMDWRHSTNSNICVHSASSKGDSCSGQGSQACLGHKTKENSSHVSY